MNTTLRNISLLLFTAITFSSCSNDDGTVNEIFRPSAAEFAALRDEAMDNITQQFTLTAGTGPVTFTTAKGVELTINSNCLTLNGNPVTSGQVDIKLVEVFDRGTMLVTDKTTMGKLPNGDMALIISGGEFYINGTQGGQQLDITCPMQLKIPATLTGGLQTGMSLWDGTIDADGNLDWDEQDTTGTPGPQGNGVFGEGQGANAVYYAFLNDFGWTNVDRFYSDPRPKTTILAQAPAGYDFENSAIYLHYDGQGSALAKLDTFNGTQFSEHYGQVPVGLEAHVIFVTEENGNYKYAIKGVTVAAGDVYIFTDGETTLGTEAQVIAAINALP